MRRDRPGQSTWGLIPTHPARYSARSADSSNLVSVTPPLLHFSLFMSHLAQIEIHPSQPPSQLNFPFLLLSFTSFLSLSLSLPHTLASSLPFYSNFSSSDSSHCYLILSVPFSLSYLSSISPHEPYLHEAVPPRCFNHLYLFQFSALFFSQPFRSDRRGFHLNPLSTYIHGDASGDSQYASPYHFLTPSELDPAKTSLSARPCRLFFIITSIRQSGP